MSNAGGAPPPDVRSPSAPSSTLPTDRRLATFAALLTAIDRRDTPATIGLIRDLRRLGYSVVLTGQHQAAPANRQADNRRGAEGDGR